MSEYTPGPWKWWTSNSFLRLSSKATGKDGGVIDSYVMSDGHSSLSVTYADMALIAAAPELLEALQEMVSAIKITLRVGNDRIIELGGDCDSPEVMIKGHPEIARAEAAIKKALGQ